MAFTTITPGRMLATTAALSYVRMIRDGMPTGGINSAWRSVAEQEKLFYANYQRSRIGARRPYDVRVYKGVAYYRKIGGVAVAVPGTSTHTDGLALDLGYAQRTWLREHGEQYGWIWPDWARKATSYEPWHFEYDETQDTHADPEPAHITKPRPVKDGDAPMLRNDMRTTGQKLTPNRWNTIKVTNKGGVSTAFGAREFDSDVVLQISAPQGVQVRARFYRIDYKTGKRTYTYDRESKVDSPVTKGSTLMFALSCKGQLAPTERLRVEIYTWNDGVEIANAAYRTHEWN